MLRRIIKYLKDIPVSDRRTCVISIGDIFLSQGTLMNQTQFLAISRYIDVKRYIEEKDSSFSYRNTFCEILFGLKHSFKRSNYNFENLIKSISINGFDSSFPPVLNNEGYLIDGNHRCGICLYLKIESLTVRINVKERRIPRNIDNYLENGIPIDLIKNIWHEFKNIQKWLIDSGNTFAIYVDGINEEKQVDNFISRVSFICTILKITKSHYGRILIQFCVENPQYEYSNGVMISKRCFKIERVLNSAFPNLNLTVSKSCLEGHSIVKNFKTI